MLEVGKLNTLNILRDTSVGMFLGGQDMDDILLPNRYVPIDKRVGDEIEVFVYLDSEDRLVATTDLPLAMADEFAAFEVKEVNNIGAFLDWGLEKDLLVPFKEQVGRLKKGDKVVARVYLDEQTGRLAATTKWKQYVDREKPTVEEGEEVDILVVSQTDIGWNAIINQTYVGLLYNDEVFRNLEIGDQRKAYIKKVREDFKIDLHLEKPGVPGIEPQAQKILQLLELNGGTLDLHDKSDPEQIKAMAQMSKKAFKKAIGSLYKARLISLGKESISLVASE